MKKTILRLFVGLILTVFVATANAQIQPRNDSNHLMSSLDQFSEKISSFVTKVTATDNAISSWSTTLWEILAIILITTTLAKYILKAVPEIDLGIAVLVVMLTWLLMGEMNTITSALWTAFSGAGNELQGIAFGRKDWGFTAVFLRSYIDNMVFPNFSLFSIGAGIIQIFLIGILTVLSMLLYSLVLLGTQWAAWGFSLAKVLGVFIVPFVMLKETRFIFDGWLRFMLGFLVYVLIVRINFILTIFLFQGFFDTSTALNNQAINLEETVQTAGNSLSLMSLFVLSIYSFAVAAKFSSQIVGGVPSLAGITGTVAAGIRGFK